MMPEVNYNQWDSPSKPDDWVVDGTIYLLWISSVGGFLWLTLFY